MNPDAVVCISCGYDRRTAARTPVTKSIEIYRIEKNSKGRQVTFGVFAAFFGVIALGCLGAAISGQPDVIGWGCICMLVSALSVWTLGYDGFTLEVNRGDSGEVLRSFKRRYGQEYDEEIVSLDKYTYVKFIQDAVRPKGQGVIASVAGFLTAAAFGEVGLLAWMFARQNNQGDVFYSVQLYGVGGDLTIHEGEKEDVQIISRRIAEATSLEYDQTLGLFNEVPA
jgi:hypothetical protein